MAKKEKVVYAEEGEKIKVEKCPTCNEELVVSMQNGGTEVFECKNCKFVKKK